MTRFPGITPNMISGEGQRQVRAALSEGFCPFDSTALNQNGYCPVCTTRWTLHHDGIYSYTASFVYVPD